MELTPIAPNQVVAIPLTQIEPDPDQPRRHIDPVLLEQLAADIKARGVQQPITVRKPVINGELYTIKTGERRWRASLQAGKRNIPCILAGQEEASDIEGNRNVTRLVDQVCENEHREALGALDWAYTFKALKDDHGMKVTEIAEVFAARGFKHLSRPHISNIMRLTELPIWAQQALKDRRISAAHGKHLFSALHSLQVSEEIERLIKEPDAEPLSVRELQNAILEAYYDYHREAYELGYPGMEKLITRLDEIGVVEIAGTSQRARFVVDQGKYDAARAEASAARAAQHSAGGGATSEDHDDDEPREDEDETDDDEAGDEDEAPDAHPMVNIDGKVADHVVRNRLERSLETYIREQLLQHHMTADDLQRLGAWRAFDLYEVDEEEYRRDDITYETSADLSHALDTEAPQLASAGWPAWQSASTLKVLDVLAVAGRQVVQIANPDLLLELALHYGIGLDAYRINFEYCESRQPDELDAMLNALVFEGTYVESELPRGFGARVEVLTDNAHIFGVPDSITATWDRLNAEHAEGLAERREARQKKEQQA